MSATLITSRDPKGIHTVGLFEAAYNRARLDDDRAQRLNERGGEFQEGILKLIAELSIFNRYADEEVKSNYGYPRKYKFKPLAKQIDELRKHFPELDLEATQEFINTILPTLKLPEGAEGWFAIPRWEKIAQTYNEAVERVLTAMASTRKFTNYREGELGPDRLRQSQRTIDMFKKIGETQQGDILIIAGQFGLLHRGRSVRRARAVFTPNEFGFGSFVVGCMLLIHPERLERYEDLFLDCAGDEYDYPGGGGLFDLASYFLFRDGRVRFGTYWVSDTIGRYGAASGWSPQ